MTFSVIALYLVLSSLMVVGLYECVKGLKSKDFRAAGVWAVIACVMIGLITFVTLVPNLDF